MFNELCLAEKVCSILDALSIKTDFMHIIALTARIDPNFQIVALHDLYLSDGSKLLLAGRNNYLVEKPAQLPFTFTSK